MNNLCLLMAQPAEGQTAGGGWQMLIFFAAIILIFWLFMVRPNQKRAKKEQEARAALKKGDNVVTIGGIHGRIHDVQDATLVLEVEDGSKIKVEKSAIAIDINARK